MGRDLLSQEEKVEYYVEHKDLNSLTSDFLSESIREREDAAQLFSALSVYSGVGHTRTLEAFDYIKKTNFYRYRFQPLIDELRHSTGTFSTALVTLVNCLIAGAETHEDRMRLRNELIGLKLLPTLDRLRFPPISSCFQCLRVLFHHINLWTTILTMIKSKPKPRKEEGDNGDLQAQLDTFEDQKTSDEEDPFPEAQRIDLTSHVDLFYAILKQVNNTPNDATFLQLLQHLLQIDPKDPNSEVNWSLAAYLVERARLVESQKEADWVKRQQNGGFLGSEKLRCPQCHSQQQPQQQIQSPTSAKKSRSYGSPAPNGQKTFAEQIAERNVSSVSPPPPPPSSLPSLNHKLTSPPPPGPPPPPPPLASMKPPPPPPLPIGGKTNSNQTATAGRSSGTEVVQLQMGSAQQTPPVVPRNKLKTLAWNKVPTAKVVASPDNMWLKAAPKLKGFAFDYKRLEELFSVQQPSAKDSDSPAALKGTVERKKKEIPPEVNLLAPQRSLNVGIFLRHLKEGGEELLDVVRGKRSALIGVEQLKGLMKILPQLDEIESLNAYDGDRAKLGVPERFFIQLCGIPNFRLRAECLLLKEEFPSAVEFIRASLDVVIAAAKELLDNRKLPVINNLILMAGNFLNFGTYGGNAAGFQISGLLKLAELRGNNRTMNLLHFVVSEAERLDSSLCTFPGELTHLERAERVSSAVVRSDVASWQDKVNRIATQLANCSDLEILRPMETFLECARNDLRALESSLGQLDLLRLKLAEFLCEDATKFKLEESFATLRAFCSLFTQALAENRARKIQEERQAAKKATSHMSLTPASMDQLSKKYGIAASSDDITLTTYFRDATTTAPTESPDGGVKTVGNSATMGRMRSATHNQLDENDNNLYALLSGESQPFSRRTASFRQSTRKVRPGLPGFGNIDRERPIVTPIIRPGKVQSESPPGATPTVDKPWRERVDELLHDDEVQFKTPSSSVSKRSSLYMTANTSVSSNATPTANRNRLSLDMSAAVDQTNSNRQSAGEVVEQKWSSTHFEPQFSRTWRTQSLSSAKSPLNSDRFKSLSEAQSADVIQKGVEKPVNVDCLDELLSSLTTDLSSSTNSLSKFPSNGIVVGRRRKSVVSGEVNSQKSTGDRHLLEQLAEEQKESESLTPPPKPPRPTTIRIEGEMKLDIDEIVRQCEVTRSEIDSIGCPTDDPVWPPTKSLRDSGVADLNSAVSPCAPDDLPKSTALLPNFTFSTSVEGPMISTDEDVKSGEFNVDFAFTPVVESAADRRACESETDEELQVGSESSEDRCKSATDFSSDAEIPPLPQSHSQQCERDEGFETCSQTTPEQSESRAESIPTATVEVPKSRPVEKAQPQPSYLRSTKSSTFKTPLPTTKDSSSLTKRVGSMLAPRKPSVVPITTAEPKKSGSTPVLPRAKLSAPSSTSSTRRSMPPRQMSSSSSNSSSPSPRQANTIVRKPTAPQRPSLSKRTATETTSAATSSATLVRAKPAMATGTTGVSDKRWERLKSPPKPTRTATTATVAATAAVKPSAPAVKIPIITRPPVKKAWH